MSSRLININIFKKKILPAVEFLSAAIAFFCMFMSFLIFFGCHIVFTDKGLLSNNIQYPISSPKSIAVDHLGNIYLSLIPYDRIQKYDKFGGYVTGWFIPPKNGNFCIGIEEDNRVHVVTQTKRHLVYNLEGELKSNLAVSSQDEYSLLVSKYFGSEIVDKYDNIYKIQSRIWSPKVFKYTSAGDAQILIKDSLWRWCMAIPVPLLVFASIALLLSISLEGIKKWKN